MARGRSPGLSIVELERMLEDRRSSVQKLQRQRGELQKKMDVLDKEIAKAGGGVESKSRTAGGRVRNGVSLVEAMESVLKGKEPMKVGDILTAVTGTGYRSSSANFRGIVNQTLIKDKRFAQAGRGMYTMK